MAGSPGGRGRPRLRSRLLGNVPRQRAHFRQGRWRRARRLHVDCRRTLRGALQRAPRALPSSALPTMTSPTSTRARPSIRFRVRCFFPATPFEAAGSAPPAGTPSCCQSLCDGAQAAASTRSEPAGPLGRQRKGLRIRLRWRSGYAAGRLGAQIEWYCEVGCPERAQVVGSDLVKNDKSAARAHL